MQGLAIGAGLAQGLAGFGKAYLDTVNTFEDNALKREQIAISKEAAMMKRQEYEEGLKPVKVSEFSRGMAPEMWQPLYDTAKNIGIVKGQGADEYFQKKDLQEFGENLKKNSIAKAQLLSKSMELLNKERGAVLQKAQQTKETIEKFQSSWQYEYDKLKSDAANESKKSGKSVPINYDKEKALMEKKAAFLAEGHLDKFNEYSKIVTNITDKHFKYQHLLDILDEGYKEDVKKYGKEDALLLHTGLTSRDYLDRKQQKMKQEEHYSAMADYVAATQPIIQKRQLALQEAKEAGIRSRPVKSSTTKPVEPIVGSESGKEMYLSNGSWYYTANNQPVNTIKDKPGRLGKVKSSSGKESIFGGGEAALSPEEIERRAALQRKGL